VNLQRLETQAPRVHVDTNSQLGCRKPPRNTVRVHLLARAKQHLIRWRRKDDHRLCAAPGIVPGRAGLYALQHERQSQKV
jgi:hypothetical protein